MSGVNVAGGTSAQAGDRWDVALDLDSNKVWFRTTRNPGKWNNSGAANPSMNAGGIDISAWRGSAAVSMGAQGNGAGSGWAANFGNYSHASFAGSPPAGFTPGFGT